MMARPASQPSYAYVGTVASPPGPLAGAKAMQAIYNCSGKTDLIITYGGRWLPVALCRHVLRSLDARARRRAGPNRRTRPGCCQGSVGRTARRLCRPGTAVLACVGRSIRRARRGDVGLWLRPAAMRVSRARACGPIGRLSG
jgi:hypothetical protein